MTILHDPLELQSYLDPSRKVAFVPTMGALHEGHASLIRRGCDFGQVVVSVFVNPTQFGPNEDFEKYPRDLGKDALIAAEAGAEVLFAPSADVVYPRPSTMIHVAEVTETFEGPLRPGHFAGVATVVQKLFGMVKPDIALFGLKDLQQCAVLNRMVQDLWLPIQLLFCPTYREADGLAMSSRNAYLSESERRVAPLIYQVLNQIRSEWLETGYRHEALDEGSNRLTDAGFNVQYLDLIDFANMRSTDRVYSQAVIAVAARLGTTRLIDNLPLFEPFHPEA